MLGLAAMPLSQSLTQGSKSLRLLPSPAPGPHRRSQPCFRTGAVRSAELTTKPRGRSALLAGPVAPRRGFGLGSLGSVDISTVCSLRNAGSFTRLRRETTKCQHSLVPVNRQCNSPTQVIQCTRRRLAGGRPTPVGNRPPVSFASGLQPISHQRLGQTVTRQTDYFSIHHESAFQLSFGQMLDSHPIK
jgi:hypothetical protein